MKPKYFLFLIPVALLLFNFLPFSLYKDKVDFYYAKNPTAKIESTEDAIKRLSPGHWKLRKYSTEVTYDGKTTKFNLKDVLDDIGSLESTSSSGSDNASIATQLLASSAPSDSIYSKAKFRGFPFAAHFSIKQQTGDDKSGVKYIITGYSWLWFLVDTLFWLLSLGVVVFIVFIRKNKSAMQQAFDQPLPMTNTVSSVISNATTPVTVAQTNQLSTPSNSNEPTTISTVQPIVSGSLMNDANPNQPIQAENEVKFGENDNIIIPSATKPIESQQISPTISTTHNNANSAQINQPVSNPTSNLSNNLSQEIANPNAAVIQPTIQPTNNSSSNNLPPADIANK